MVSLNVVCFVYCVHIAQFDGRVLSNMVLSALQEVVFFAGLDQLLE